MIAQSPLSTVASTATMGTKQPLSADELYRLTLYKWRYSLEAFGFDDAEVSSLLFLKWLHCTRRVRP